MSKVRWPCSPSTAKEGVIASVLDTALGCRVERVTGDDTDLLGTFTREIPRAGMQLEAARKKARIGMELSGLSTGLASEGSFGPDPMGDVSLERGVPDFSR